jgi:predicted HNH restriction endonuclease
MELRLLRSFNEKQLSYDLLKQNGLHTVRSPSRVTEKLESFILNRTSEEIRKVTRRYFFVFQNKSFEEEYKGGYLWAPQRGDKGRRVSHWEKMKEVKMGDLIIHSYKTEIVAISIAKTDVYEANRPAELPDHWNNKGWKVDSDYFIISKPIVISEHSEHMEKLMELQPDKDSPFNRNGRGNTGYLFAANREMAEYIINKTVSIQDNEADKRILLDLIENNSIESNLDQDLIDTIGEMLQSISTVDIEYTAEPKKKPEPQVSSGKKFYPRDRKIAANALSRAKHKCEVDTKHPSFIRKNTTLHYTEPHHLIPTAYQDSFENSLDVEANIVALCSNCHNQIHYGDGSEELLKELYKKRKEELEQAGIPISLGKLLSLY